MYLLMPGLLVKSTFCGFTQKKSAPQIKTTLQKQRNFRT